LLAPFVDSNKRLGCSRRAVGDGSLWPPRPACRKTFTALVRRRSWMGPTASRRWEGPSCRRVLTASAGLVVSLGHIADALSRPSSSRLRLAPWAISNRQFWAKFATLLTHLSRGSRGGWNCQPIPREWGGCKMRCGAKTRSGERCRSPAVGGKQRCRMHGGARGSGGPCGDRNGNYRHGRYSKEHEAKLQPLRQLMLESRELTRMLRSNR